MAGERTWLGKKIHLYNVTMGLYMLDWWEQCLFTLVCASLTVADLLMLTLLWFIGFNGSRFATDIYER
nr:unnamed protein product [Digitaria exilis]